jgi:precorrin-6B methylase 2
MRKGMFAALFLVLVCSSAQADDKDDVLQAEAAFNQAKIHNDIAALDRLVADNFVEINQKGERRDKQALLHTSFGMTSLVGSRVTVRITGDTATIDGIMNQNNLHRFLFLRTYVKRNGHWLLLSTFQGFPVDLDTMKALEVGVPPASHPVTGRQYAGVMGPAGADWLVRSEREQEEEPDKAVAALEIAKGSTVADIGAGVGYFSWRLAEAVGPAGKVYANDIQPDMIRMLKKNLEERNLTNVVPVLGKLDDPMLPKGAIDLALLVDVYHEFSEPQKMLDHIRESLKPDGRLVLLEYRREDPKVPIRAEHKMTVDEVKAEIEPQGYKLDKVLEILPRQHIIIFKPR